KRRSPRMETLEYPAPTPVIFQASGGPPGGHCLRSPVSGERPSRFGPRHWFQSLFSTPSVPEAGTARSIAVVIVERRIMERFTLKSPNRVPLDVLRVY